MSQKTNVQLHSTNFFFLILISLLIPFSLIAQVPLYADIPVSDLGTGNNNNNNNNIGSANTSRNVAVGPEGNIYVVYTNGSEIRITKSTNGGQNFLPSVLVSNTNLTEPELAVNDAGIVLVAWSENGNINISSSLDLALSFSTPTIVGVANGDVHMSTFGNNVFLIDQSGVNLFSNNNNGIGTFYSVATGQLMVY